MNYAILKFLDVNRDKGFAINLFVAFLLRCFTKFRACLRGVGGPQVGEVARLGGVSIKISTSAV